MSQSQHQTNTQPEKEYIYNFVGGGWNSEFAHDKYEAMRKAKKRWSNKPYQIDMKSFRVKSELEYKHLLSLFN